jgi:hypothetical protein
MDKPEKNDHESNEEEEESEEIVPPTIEEVLNMTEPADFFYTEKSDNTYGIRFNSFKVRDVDSGEVFMDAQGQSEEEFDKYWDTEIEYVFPYRLLRAKSIGTNIGMVVGTTPVKNMYFIERHYYGDILLDTYSFKFPFFMPNSENNIEFIYNVPKLPDAINESIKSGTTFLTQADTFVFIEEKLVIHRKSQFFYIKDEEYAKLIPNK